MINQLLFAFIIFLSTMMLQISHCSALQCYVCNSKIHKDCDDPINTDSIALVDCAKRIKFLRKNVTYSPENLVCRKIVQKIEKDIRYVRECGFLKSDKEDNRDCINLSGSFEISNKYCKCNSDGCNSVGRLIPSILAMFACLFISLRN